MKDGSHRDDWRPYDAQIRAGRAAALLGAAVVAVHLRSLITGEAPLPLLWQVAASGIAGYCSAPNAFHRALPAAVTDRVNSDQASGAAPFAAPRVSAGCGSAKRAPGFSVTSVWR